MKKFLWIVLPFICLMSCRDDDAQPAATLTFAESSSQVQEDGNLKVIELVMSHAMDTDVEVSYEISGRAAENGHYALVTPSPVIIEAGSSRGEIVFEAIDNTVIEVENATFTVALTSATGATLGENGSQTHQVEIIDNNVVPQNDLQLDLLWSLEGEQDIDLVDLDMLLITDIVEEDNTIVDFSVVDVSEAESGFESVLLQESDPDGEYYMVVFYIEGDRAVDFWINGSNSALGSGELLEDRFEANEAGSGRVYGPIPKQGNTYLNGRKAPEKLSSLYKGTVSTARSSK